MSPLYDYVCGECGEVMEARADHDVDALLCQRCGALAHRVAVYESQYTHTESGGMQGRMGKSCAGSASASVGKEGA